MNEKLLVADDDEALRKGFEKIMRRNGFEVDTADTGETVRRKIKSKEYDIILLDLVFGDMNGNELVKEIKSEIPGAVIIIITGYPSVNTAVETLRDGAYDYIVKPVTNNELLSKIRNGLKGKGLINTERGFTSDLPNQKYAYELNRQLSIIIGNVKCMHEKKGFMQEFEGSNWIESYIYNINNAGIRARENLLRLVDDSKFESLLINREESEFLKITKEYRVLVIDNDKRYCELIKNVLLEEKCNFIIEYVLSGKEAIERLKSTAYNLVFLDVNMEDCIPMIEKIKTINRNCMICLMEDRWRPNKNLKDALKTGVSGCIYKPFYNEELLNITKMISESTSH